MGEKVMPTTKTIVIHTEHSKQAFDLFRAIYQSINHEVSLRKEQAW